MPNLPRSCAAPKTAQHEICPRPDKATRLRDFLPAGVLALAGLAALVVLTLGTGGEARGQYLVIGPPGMGHDAIAATITRAGAGVVGFARLPNVAIAWSEDPQFPAAARAQGAWLVLPASGLTGCIALSEGKTP